MTQSAVSNFVGSFLSIILLDVAKMSIQNKVPSCGVVRVCGPYDALDGI